MYGSCRVCGKMYRRVAWKVAQGRRGYCSKVCANRDPANKRPRPKTSSKPSAKLVPLDVDVSFDPGVKGPGYADWSDEEGTEP